VGSELRSPLDDVFAIQTDIAKAIAVQLQGEALTSGESRDWTASDDHLIAYDRYLRAKKARGSTNGPHPGDMREVTRLLDQAVSVRSNILLAYCELARAHALCLPSW